MRKDAKIGFAIGALLLAVLTVYAIVVPKKRTAVAQGVKVVPQGIAGITPPKEPAVDANPVVSPPAIDPVPAPVAKADPPPAPGPVADATAPKTADNVDWEKLIGKQPAMMTSTPETHGSDAESNGVSPPAVSPTPTPDPTAALTHPFAETQAGVATLVRTNPNTTPSRHSARPHAAALASGGSSGQYVVEEGDTLSSVAAEKYGAAHFYVQIMKANPSINPNRLRPGTKIVMPDLSAAIAAAKSSDTTIADVESPRTSVRVDADGAAGGGVFTPNLASETLFAATPTGSDSTYTVASGDSLYRISKKLYGTPRMAHQIFAANADAIGPDMAKLKLGMVLTLPEPPTNR